MTEWHKLDILKLTVQPASTDMVESGLDLYQRMTRVSSMSKELKPATTISEQIKTLRERGMQVDEQLAWQWLSNVSYYRLSAYWYPAKKIGSRGEALEEFRDGTSFDDVVALYEADRKLRTLVFDAIERIETTMRTRIGESLCADDPLFYLNPKNFRAEFEHKGWLQTAQKRVERVGRRNESIQHYRDCYDSRFPFWVLAEVLDFSDVSRLYDGMRVSDQRRIAESLEIKIDLSALSRGTKEKLKKQSPLARWLEQFAIIRNTCAHHGRLWNKSFTPAPTSALKSQTKFSALPARQSERIFGAIVVMSHLLRVTSPGTTWPDKVSRLLVEEFLQNPLVRTPSLGIPQEWNRTF